ncbi:alpha/beta hydrolase [Paenimyroides tangerinum]|uniref:Alpha/beta hydrolase n=1 Tax=Paenimyroides tangerinum TaxID=2488728 RepID=A0A3P3W7G3_9FLAO|nr:alpha/beta hydrolase [Paenimyroides tangerinum]RRJ90277.1 alpha/beta hydrolase [Paenimyroides tangerinum]
MTKLKKSLETPKYIKRSAKLISFFSDKLAVQFAMKLFITPIKFPTPNRELNMEKKSKIFPLELPKAKKDFMVYENGNGSKKALLIHGWNGRGTQLVSIAKELVDLDYTVVSFDAPGHGKSSKNTTVMTDFIEAAFVLERYYKGFDLIIGHSLGAMSTINVLGRGFKAKKAITIGSGDEIINIIKDFVKTIGLNEKIAHKLKEAFEAKYNKKIENYTVHEQIKKIEIPIFIIHDKNDLDVPYSASENIHRNAKNSKLLLTEKLGHRKILGDSKVIAEIKEFVSKKI